MVWERQKSASGSPWEARVGYSRAVRHGPLVWVSGTTATDAEGAVLWEGDAFGQARCVFEKIARALEDVGATLADVVRTRMYVTDIEDWKAVGRAHKEAFGDGAPCATLVQVAGLIAPGLLVEIEVDAVVAR